MKSLVELHLRLERIIWKPFFEEIGLPSEMTNGWSYLMLYGQLTLGGLLVIDRQVNSALWTEVEKGNI